MYTPTTDGLELTHDIAMCQIQPEHQFFLHTQTQQFLVLCAARIQGAVYKLWQHCCLEAVFHSSCAVICCYAMLRFSCLKFFCL